MNHWMPVIRWSCLAEIERTRLRVSPFEGLSAVPGSLRASDTPRSHHSKRSKVAAGRALRQSLPGGRSPFSRSICGASPSMNIAFVINFLPLSSIEEMIHAASKAAAPGKSLVAPLSLRIERSRKALLQLSGGQSRRSPPSF